MSALSEDYSGYLSDTPVSVSPELPLLDKTFSTAVLVSNLPLVPPDKVDKLLGVLRKIFAKVDLTLDDSVAPLHMPFNK